jgi:hypothetical protein
MVCIHFYDSSSFCGHVHTFFSVPCAGYCLWAGYI